MLHDERFVDRPPADVVAALLDEGRYLCSTRTMYRILDTQGEVRERRNQLEHPHYAKPELLATRPNEVWSWDITKLKGPAKWTYYQLYVILDIFSRYVVGWMVAEQESSTLAKRLIGQTCLKQEILPDQLTLHADRGSSMKSKPLAMMLSDLGVTKTHSRPHVSNDNPFSESQFKTLKYRPGFPARFGSLQDAAPSARNSSRGTTPSTTTQASPGSPQRTCTTAGLSKSSRSASRRSMTHLRYTLNGSATSRRARLTRPRPCG